MSRPTSRPKSHQPGRGSAELQRLREDAERTQNWKRWGPYLSERQWGSVREDYSPDGSAWRYFPHDHARSRAYRWGEDGLFGFTDRQCRLCFAFALWNGADEILKERLFGLTGDEGNHGEDVKECYYYLDSTPTHAYMRALYKYPQRAFPYARLLEENQQRGKDQPEFELLDTGIFDDQRYFDVFVEYAKAAPEDVLIRVTAHNRGPSAAQLWLLPTLWLRNTWAWGRTGESYDPKGTLHVDAHGHLVARQPTLGTYALVGQDTATQKRLEWLLTDNETNKERLYQIKNDTPFVKDGFHEHLIEGRSEAVHAGGVGTKAAAVCRFEVPAGDQVQLELRLFPSTARPAEPFGRSFAEIFALRERESQEFYAGAFPECIDPEHAAIVRQSTAGLLWTKQFYHYIVRDWLEGDPAQPPPPPSHKSGRNSGWSHLYNRDVLSMPDSWEYPWYAAWDLAFHMVVMALVDVDFAKQQLSLFLREWYMHPNGQIPAYEWAFSDVNPPVHAWAVWRVYKRSGPRGKRDHYFLASAFQKLLLNFTWWVNRKDEHGKHIFAGGFLGLDNIGVFDRSQPLPGGASLAQADGTAWMAFYCGTMLSMALELALFDRAYEDMASKFFEHFVAIADAMNELGGMGLWSEEDGFYYDQVQHAGQVVPLRLRSFVGAMPLIAAEVIDQDTIDRLPGFKKRMTWFLENRQDLARNISYMSGSNGESGRRLLAIPSRKRLERVLAYLFDEREFLSPYGLRSLSKVYAEHPYELHIAGRTYRVDYAPGDSTTAMFGGNSNWRGPVWFPTNLLLLESLQRYYHFYGDDFKIEYPTGSGRKLDLQSIALELGGRLAKLFVRDGTGQRPCHGRDRRYAEDPHWKDLILFYEYFHGDDGHGLGANHQTGWTATVAQIVRALTRYNAGEAIGAADPALQGGG